jgi:autotransporter-associated beta strand protein/T5SS/PEP-CTERM-associated repeat protein
VAVPIKRVSGRSHARLRIAALLAGVTLPAVAVHAQDATWTPPVGPSADWNTAANWTNNNPPPTHIVPLGTATFNAANAMTVTFASSALINTLQFNVGAPLYTFAIGSGTFTINGEIVNNSAFAPNFTVNSSGGLNFFGFSPTIGSLADGTSGGGSVLIGGVNTTLFIAGNTGTTFSGTLGGLGSLELDNAASLTLTGASNGGNIGTIGGDLTLCNCVTGGLTISGGSLTVNGFTAVLGGTLAVINGGALNSSSGAGIDTATATVTGPGSTWNVDGFFGLAVGGFGPGALTISNGGVVNVLSGITTIGDLFDGSSKVTVTGAGSVLNAFSGLEIGGGCGCNPALGTLTIADGGVVNSPSGTTIGPGSTLNLGTGGLAGAIITPFIINDGLISANFTDMLTLAAAISGGGALSKSGPGTLILTADNTYTGGTTINGGTLQLGNGGTSGSIVGDVTDNGTLAINRSDVFTFGGAISGIGGFAQNGTGTTILTANNTYAGPTAVNAGILQAGAPNVFAPSSAFTVASGATLNLASFDQTIGSLAGAGGVTLGSATLTTGNDTTSTIFAGTISGSGSLIKIGGGTFVLSGINNYTGNTVVNAGTLEVDGTIANSASVTVNAGAKLSGTGTVDPPGVTIISSGGTLAPGNPTNPTGTLTITGNLAFQSGAIYLIQVTSGSASSTSVVGSASLGGTVQAVLAPGMYLPGSYTILHSAGLNGTTFNGITANVPANFIAGLSYTPTDVLLNLVPQLGVNAGAIFNLNQQAVANAINGFINNGGKLPPGFFGLLNLTGGNLANALTLLSGEAATGAQQGAFQLVSEFLSLMLDPFVDGRGGIGGAFAQASPFAPEREALPEDIALAYAKVLRSPVAKAIPFEERWSVWGGAYGGYNKTSGDPVVVGSHDLTARTAGVAAGLDYRVAPGTVIGFALAGGGTGWSLAQNLGSGGSNAFQAGVYATTRSGPLYLAGALAFTQHWMSTDRFAFAGDRLYASFNAESVGGRAEAGYRIAGTVAAVTPYAAVQAQNFHTPTYSETDYSGGVFGLTYNAHNATDTRSELGARFDKQILFNWNSVLALRGKLAWGHDWISDPSVMPTFQALPGASFIVQGATPAKNSALTSAGAELRLINGVSLLGKFDGEFAAHSQTYAGTGTVRYTW